MNKTINQSLETKEPNIKAERICLKSHECIYLITKLLNGSISNVRAVSYATNVCNRHLEYCELNMAREEETK